MSTQSQTEHKGIKAIIKNEDGELCAITVNASSVQRVYGKTFKEVQNHYRDLIEDYIAICEEVGVPAAKEFSGKFVLRLSPELHESLVVGAAYADMSLNDFVLSKIKVASMRVVSQREERATSSWKSFGERRTKSVNGNELVKVA